MFDGLLSKKSSCLTQLRQAFREGGDLSGLASALRTLAAAHLQKKLGTPRGKTQDSPLKKLSRQETPNSVLEGVYVLNQNFDT